MEMFMQFWPFTSFFSVPSIYFPQLLVLYYPLSVSALEMRAQVLQPYKTRGLIRVLISISLMLIGFSRRIIMCLSVRG
jgi:hypothetical protein